MRIDIKGVIVRNADKAAYEFYGIDSVCPQEVCDEIKRAGGGEIDVYINSGGGDLTAGLDIYTELRDYKGQVQIHIIYACSAAGIIACARENDIIPPALFMIHNVSGGFMGDYHDMEKGSEILKKANEAIAEAYMEKTGKSKEEIIAMMDRETWLTSAEALEYGLADKISEGQQNVQLAAAANGLLPRAAIQKAKDMEQAKSASCGYEYLRAKYNFLKLKGEVK